MIRLKQASFKSPVIWLFAWMILSFAYVFSLRKGVMMKQWDYIICSVQLGIDIILGVFSYLAYKSQDKIEDRRLYLFIFLSLIPGLFANEIYNILVNIIHIRKSKNFSLYWSFAYTLFLYFQGMGWGYLLTQNKTKNESLKIRVSIYPYYFSAGIILLSLSYIVLIRESMGFVGWYKVFNSVIEIMVFTLLSICLSRTKDKSLIQVEVGFLILIGFNFAHRYSDMMSRYFKIFDVAWICCLILIIYGLYLSYKSEKYKTIMFQWNAIHVLTSGAFILFANIILALFIVMAFGFSLFQNDRVSDLHVLALNIPTALIFSYTLTVLLVKYLAWHLTAPLQRIAHRIDNIAVDKNDFQNGDNYSLDIYEIQALEDFIAKTVSELRHANRVKSEFMMNMSHDFRTPASGMMNMSKLIYDHMIEHDEFKPLQKLIVDSSEQLMGLLEAVLDYSRLENDKLVLSYENIDMVMLVDELVRLMSAKLQESNLSIFTEFHQAIISYYGDKVVIQRILINLLSNAIKFTQVGCINVSITSEVLENFSYLKITIKDTGIEIDKSNYSKIFEPFYKVASSHLASYSGIGLGLSNVKFMLKKIGGDIELKSELGQGSEFSVLLPI